VDSQGGTIIGIGNACPGERLRKIRRTIGRTSGIANAAVFSFGQDNDRRTLRDWRFGLCLGVLGLDTPQTESHHSCVSDNSERVARRTQARRSAHCVIEEMLPLLCSYPTRTLACLWTGRQLSRIWQTRLWLHSAAWFTCSSP
jgi:hypothetical protein